MYIFYMNLIDFKSKFDWKGYVSKYPDLKGADTLEKAWRHANNFGWKEKRVVFTESDLQDKFIAMKNSDSNIFNSNNILIVMPTYNRSENIEKSIEMINNQSYKNWIFLIIDDGSLEAHKIKFKEIKEKYKDNNKLIFMENETNLHIAETLNRGIKYLLDNKQFSHFTWISDDNIYYPNFIEQLQNNNTYFSHSSWDIQELDGSNNTNNTQYISFDDVLNKFNGCASFMWSKSAIQQIGYYSEGLKGSEDFEYLLRTFQLNNVMCNFINIPLMKYIRHEDAGMEKNKEEVLQAKQEIINKYNNVLNDKKVSIQYEKKKFQYPKLMFLYWDGSPLSYLNYLTIISFNHYNPGWKITVYIPTRRTQINT